MLRSTHATSDRLLDLVAATWCLAPSVLALHLAGLGRARNSLAFWLVYTGVLAAIGALGSASELTEDRTLPEAAAAPFAIVAIAADLFSFRLDVATVRRLSRRNLKATAARRPGLGDDFAPYRLDTWQALPVFALIGVLEEFAARNVLLGAMNRVMPEAASLLVVTILFCLWHIEFGWRQVLAKAPLSIVASTLVAATGHWEFAALAHATHNILILFVRRTAGAGGR